jgi:hypothetical protein
MMMDSRKHSRSDCIVARHYHAERNAHRPEHERAEFVSHSHPQDSLLYSPFPQNASSEDKKHSRSDRVVAGEGHLQQVLGEGHN